MLKTLKLERERRHWSQQEAAQKLGVSQPYLSMLETGKRALTPELARKVRQVYELPATVVPAASLPPKGVLPDDQALAEDLGQLGYPGFAYLRTRRRVKNPAEVLVTALAQENRHPRLTEALPWVLLHYAEEMDADWLLKEAKLHNLQNRLGFLVTLAREVAEKFPQFQAKGPALLALEAQLKQSRLATEDTLCQASLPAAKRRWLQQNRPPEAAYWNLLTDWQLEHLRYVT